jgi:hypothetical protein
MVTVSNSSSGDLSPLHKPQKLPCRVVIYVKLCACGSNDVRNAEVSWAPVTGDPDNITEANRLTRTDNDI